MKPTEQQSKIINYSGNCVVIAKPGSGKSQTLAWKIRGIVQDQLPYQGVIAISFTNRASSELKAKCLAAGIEGTNCFYGTIDKFFISELIRPFLKYFFGQAPCEVQTKRISAIESSELQTLAQQLSDADEDWDDNALPDLRKLYCSGTIPLELVGKIANYILNNCRACQNYLKARYTYLMIDEYQDSGKEQHQLFLNLMNLGIKTVAVGDPSQSIFGFTGKSSTYLIELTSRDDFQTFSLSKNYRCHNSIINYSTTLLDPNAELLETNSIQVFYKFVQGDESKIGQWMDMRFEKFKQGLKVASNSDIGILVNRNRTANLITANMTTPHKVYVDTNLDRDSSLWSGVFRKILHCVVEKEINKYEFAEEYFSPASQNCQFNRLVELLSDIEACFAEKNTQGTEVIDNSTAIARLIYPTASQSPAIELLEEVVSSPDLLDSYGPPQPEQVQIMTLHKAKGLEFDLVFHLDLYQWILPCYEAIKGNQALFEQDLNLHYVGITRARKACVLCSSSLRNNANEKRTADESVFLAREGLDKLRTKLVKKK